MLPFTRWTRALESRRILQSRPMKRRPKRRPEGMFDKLQQMMGLMKMVPRLQEETARLQQRLGEVVVEGDAGGGMVHVRVNGRLEVVSCQLSAEALGDREMLEDLIRAATNQALQKAR